MAKKDTTIKITDVNLFKSYEVAEHFGYPKPTISNWSKSYGTWRHRLYKQLEKDYARELAEKANEL